MIDEQHPSEEKEIELSEEEIEAREDEIYKQIVAEGKKECFGKKFVEGKDTCKKCTIVNQCFNASTLSKLVADRYRNAEIERVKANLHVLPQTEVKEDEEEMSDWDKWVMEQFDTAIGALMPVACAMRYNKDSEDLSQEEWDVIFNKTYDTLSSLLDFYLEKEPGDGDNGKQS